MVLDRYLLSALRNKSNFILYADSIVPESLDNNTHVLLSWFKKYFNKEFPEHKVVDLEALESMLRTSKLYTKDQLNVLSSLVRKLDQDVPKDVLDNTIQRLEELRYKSKAEFILQQYQAGAEVDLTHEMQVLLAETQSRLASDDNDDWEQEDIWNIMQESTAEQGYVYDFLPLEFTTNLKPVSLGKQIAYAMPTDMGKTSLLCRNAVAWAVQHKEKLIAGEEEHFRPILYLVNEGMAKAIKERIYSTALEMASEDMWEYGLASKGQSIVDSYVKIVGRLDAIRCINIHGKTVSQVGKIIAKHKPFAVFTDMTNRILAHKAEGANDTAELEQVWNTMRMFTAMYNCVHTGTAQVSAEGMDTLTPPLTALQNSKVGIQTTCDLVFMCGALQDPLEGLENVRGVNTEKNKLNRKGSKRVIKSQVMVDFERNLWK